MEGEERKGKARSVGRERGRGERASQDSSERGIAMSKGDGTAQRGQRARAKRGGRAREPSGRGKEGVALAARDWLRSSRRSKRGFIPDQVYSLCDYCNCAIDSKTRGSTMLIEGASGSRLCQTQSSRSVVQDTALAFPPFSCSLPSRRPRIVASLGSVISS